MKFFRHQLLFVTIIFSFVLSDAWAMSDKLKGCSEFVYVKVGDYILKLPNTSGTHVFYEDKGRAKPYLTNSWQSKKQHCWTSSEDPLEATEISLLKDVTIPSFEGQSYTIQYLINKVSPDSYNHLHTIRSKLAESGKKITDLPKEGPFYVYEHINKQYIADIKNYPSLKDAIDNPIRISDHNAKISILQCGVGFMWKPTIGVWVRDNELAQSLPKPSSVDSWLEIYPAYLKALDENLVSSPEGERK